MAKRVYFAFHYQDVIDFRANVVRNHWITKKDREAAGFYDASIWEEAQKTSPIAIKRLINSEIGNTSVTCVLIGDETYNRRWVRYEIFKSIYKGNKIIGLHINSITGKDGKVKSNGPNPFEHSGFYINTDGTKIAPVVWTNRQWQYFSDFEGYAPNSVWNNNRDSVVNLNYFNYPVYDWVKDDGFNNFATWVS